MHILDRHLSTPFGVSLAMGVNVSACGCVVERDGCVGVGFLGLGIGARRWELTEGGDCDCFGAAAAHGSGALVRVVLSCAVSPDAAAAV